MRDHQLRDCKAWKDERLPVSTTSDEAAKYYDAILTQFVGSYDDPQVGGLENSMRKMNEADREFVLGLSLALGLKLGGLESISTDHDLKREYESLKNLSEKSKSCLTSREYLHSKAVLLSAEGQVNKAVKVWEDILLDHPTDLHALKVLNLSYFNLGKSTELRDSVARVLPVWELKRPLMKSFVYGLYSFGLQETNEFQKAEHYAQKALDENRFDSCSTHAMAHVFDAEGRIQEGLNFMTSTVQNWEQGNHIAGHNYWHTALLHIEDENYAAAVAIFENQILKRVVSSKTIMDITDCSSLLYRLDLLNPTHFKNFNGSYWAQVFEICKPYSKIQISTFNDIHFMMTFIRTKGRASVDEKLESLKTENNGDLADHPGITRPLLEAIRDFGDEMYDKVVEGLEPLRYKWKEIGGSNTQLDVLNLMLIVAALKSSCNRNRKLARVLINERVALKPDTVLSNRLLTLI